MSWNICFIKYTSTNNAQRKCSQGRVSFSDIATIFLTKIQLQHIQLQHWNNYFKLFKTLDHYELLVNQ